MSNKYCSGAYQDKVGSMVGREVSHNLCNTMQLLHKLDESDNEYYQECLDVSQSDDFETPATWFVENDMTETQKIEFLSIHGIDYDKRDSNNLINIIFEEQDNYQEFCEEFEIEQQYIEAYEFWAVSSWLAGKLKDKGEMVEEILDFNVWGRCSTGQAILLDHVICEIYDETYPSTE